MARTRYKQPAEPRGGALAEDRARPNRGVLVAAATVVVLGAVAAAFTKPGVVVAASVFWFLEFYGGVFSLVALSLTVMVGLVVTDRVVLLVRQRVLLYAVHRALAMTAMTFLVVHILTKIAEAHADALDVVVPFLAEHRTAYIGFGTIASYLMVIAAWTGIIRGRFAGSAHPWVWRVLHSCGYLAWPVAILHGLQAGRPAKTWVTLSYLFCLFLVAVGLVIRLTAMAGRRLRTPKAQTTGTIRPVGRPSSRSSSPPAPAREYPTGYPQYDGPPQVEVYGGYVDEEYDTGPGQVPYPRPPVQAAPRGPVVGDPGQEYGTFEYPVNPGYGPAPGRAAPGMTSPGVTSTGQFPRPRRAPITGDPPSTADYWGYPAAAADVARPASPASPAWPAGGQSAAAGYLEGYPDIAGYPDSVGDPAAPFPGRSAHDVGLSEDIASRFLGDAPMSPAPAPVPAAGPGWQSTPSGSTELIDLRESLRATRESLRAADEQYWAYPRSGATR